MKRNCIWCRRDNTSTTFNKIAHTFPQSLNGKNICENVCDECNAYFGSTTSSKPAVEVCLKEVLNLSKHILLKQAGKDKLGGRFKSFYFKTDWAKNAITTKFQYKIKTGFQELFARQFRRGIYKVYLEERERQLKDAHDERFNFIRRFARYDLDDYPVYYFVPKFKAIFFSLPDILEPQIRFTEKSAQDDASYRMYEYMIMGHNFSIPSSELFNLQFDNYKRMIKETNHAFGIQLSSIKTMEDLDFTFNKLWARK